ncbi:hypothetical protein HPB50_014142 [Hyalomma asiaticum]|uniref:Uncharacterized protein n=1 Tax=Hyalomma asiaticum TaxID=266040 RepID=A0ACB7RW93_HYAAI|nr:hypothetical protein HPB50_014142 [Hyalomma asiaticum]
MPPTPNSPKTGEPSGCPGPSSSGAANRGARRRHRELGESIFHRWLPLQRHHLSPLGAGNEATVHAAPAANEAEEAAMEVSGEASASVTSPTSPSAAFLKGPSHPPISANPQRSASPSLALLHVVQRLPPPSSGALTRSQPARSLPGQWPPPIASPSCRPPNRPGGLRDGPDQGSTEKSQGRHLRCPTSGPRGAGDGLVPALCCRVPQCGYTCDFVYSCHRTRSTRLEATTDTLFEELDNGNLSDVDGEFDDSDDKSAALCLW